MSDGTLVLLTAWIILVFHFVADFLCQTDWMALNKSKDWRALTCHVAIYSIPFWIIFGWQFGVITFATHWLTDYWTSRATSRLWFFEQAEGGVNEWHYVDGKRHWFFVVIGLDQLIHASTLFATFYILQPFGSF